MFGEEIGGGHGKRTGRRVIGTEPLRVEASFEDSTHLLGQIRWGPKRRGVCQFVRGGRRKGVRQATSMASTAISR